MREWDTPVPDALAKGAQLSSAASLTVVKLSSAVAKQQSKDVMNKSVNLVWSILIPLLEVSIPMTQVAMINEFETKADYYLHILIIFTVIFHTYPLGLCFLLLLDINSGAFEKLLSFF